MIIKISIPRATTLVTLFGVFKKNRVLINVGNFAFGIMAVFDQIILFSNHSDSIHLALASL